VKLKDQRSDKKEKKMTAVCGSQAIKENFKVFLQKWVFDRAVILAGFECRSFSWFSPFHLPYFRGYEVPLCITPPTLPRDFL